ncbi:hypothetical protein C8R44DRAFT_654372, partial [Mycena epipterygia]
VDCYLISGCELALDTDNSLIQEHMEAQHMFLRRLLGLNPHSMLAVLFTETGQMPVRIRRLLLALGRLQYMVEVGPARVVHSALLDSMALLREGKSGWATDLIIMLRRLPTAIEVAPEDLLSMGDDKSLSLVTRRLRHYLVMVAVPAHRKALTGLLLGDHNLSVERLRYPARYRDAVPRQHRLCRFCRGAVEDEVHALFECDVEPRLVELRARFMQKLDRCDPMMHASHMEMSKYDFMVKLFSSRKAIQAVAMYVYLVLCLFQETARYFPVVFRIPG